MQKVVQLIDAAIKEEGLAKLSLWSKKRYLDLFDYGPEGLGAIKPNEIKAIVSFPANTSSKSIEQSLCAEYEIYQQSGFLKRAWWFFTRPVELYRKIYVLTTLRDLKAECLLLQTPLVENTASTFSALLNLLIRYAKSHLSSFEAVNSTIQGQSMPIHQKMCEMFMKLKQEMESAYKEYLYVLMNQKNNNIGLEENNPLMDDIEQWKNNLQSSFASILQGESLPLWFKDYYKGLEEQLDKMYRVLSAINRYEHNPLINAFPIALNNPCENKQENYTYPSEFQKIEHDCAVFITEAHLGKLKLESNTYTLIYQTNNQWGLFYYSDAAQQTHSIPLNQVGNLVALCRERVLNKEAIEQCIFAYHAARSNPKTEMTPTQRYKRVVNASPENRVRELIFKYSLTITVEQIKIEEKQGVQDIISTLMHYSAAKHEEKAPYVNAYLAMYKRLEIQKECYENLFGIIKKQSLAFQKAALQCVLQDAYTNNSQALSAHLLSVLLPQKFADASLRECIGFTDLSLLPKKQLEYFLDQEKVNNLNFAKKIVKSNQKKSSLSDYFRSPTSSYCETTQKELGAIRIIPNDKDAYFKNLEEKAIELIGRVICTDTNDTYTNRLALSEIKIELENHKSLFNLSVQPRPNPNSNPQTLPPKEPLNVLTPLPPIPSLEKESELAWESWLLKVMQNPSTINEAISVLEVLTKTKAPDWQSDLQRYKVLIDLVVLKLEAILWNAMLSDKGVQPVSIEVTNCLRNTNKLFARRYHPDKNNAIDEDAMKAFNVCRDKGISRIESAIEMKIKPSWIAIWEKNNPNLYANNRNIMLNKEIDAFAVEMRESFKCMEEMHKKTEDNINEIQQNLENAEPIIAEIKRFLKENQNSKNCHTNGIDPSKGSSSMGLFAENKRNIKPQPRYPASTLAPDFQQLLQAKGWDITQMSEEACNFFTAVASEIKRLKKSPELDSLSESTLRQECNAFYNKTINSKKLINTLNNTFRERSPQTYSVERTEHYTLIQHASKNEGIDVIIDGECCVEGLLFCRDYRLPAICEMTIDENNTICYAYATVNKYQSCSEVEFNAQTKDSPVLLRCDGKYYFATKAQPLHVLEDAAVRTQKSTKQTKQLINNNSESVKFTM